MLKSIFDSNGFISNIYIYIYIIYTLYIKFKHIYPLGFDTAENLYIFNNAVDLIKDNYDPNSYYVLHSCIIKTHIKDSAKDALQSMTDYCDVNVSCRFISTVFPFLIFYLYQDVLPNTLTLEDVNKVIDLCVQELASTRKIIILEGGYVTTPEYIQSLIEECQHYLYSLAQRQKQKDHKGQARNNKHRLQEPAVKARCDIIYQTSYILFL